jgi:hypothetical protein
MTVGHQKKDRNPYCIFCLECPKALYISKTSSWEQKIGNKLFFSNKKVSKGPQLSSEDVQMFKVHFEQRFGLWKETSALVNIWVISMNGKSC